MTRAEELAAIDAELTRTNAERQEVLAVLDDLQARIEQLQDARRLDLANVPVSEMRVKLAELSEAESRLPVLYQSVRELQKREERLRFLASQADKRKRRLVAVMAARESADLLLSSGALVTALDTIERATEFWPNVGEQMQTRVGQQLQYSRNALQQLVDAASAV